MKIQNIIIMNDDYVVCERCNNKVFITPVDLNGRWSCPKCNKYTNLFKIEHSDDGLNIKITK